jgi:hypothetical protein
MIFKMRPGERKIDPVDFTFFISDRALNLESLKVGEDDPYLAYWTASLVTIIDDGIMEEFWKENSWIESVLPNATRAQIASFRRTDLKTSSSRKTYPRLESIAKQLSMNRFPESIKSQMNMSSNVIVNDDMLKFHTEDDRIEIRDNWIKLYEQYT